MLKNRRQKVFLKKLKRPKTKLNKPIKLQRPLLPHKKHLRPKQRPKKKLKLRLKR
jgi:hypothetical protein